MNRLLQPERGERLLDVGCGTGWFSRRAASDGLDMVGVDMDLERLAFAHSQSSIPGWIGGDARYLPFRSQSFDRVVSIAAIGFIADERQALAEIIRVTRHRFAVAWLNRSSLLYRRKAGSVGYYGCRWCVFRCQPAGDYDVNRPPVTIQSGHLFRRQPATL
ncbi:MAG: class I SAM-dependent methyltransferase [Mariprofundaceae bacterium]|nr:class I SAM-dependent methyltransferase [Mariprofundaceae bacterium]